MSIDQRHAADLVSAMSDLVRSARAVGQRNRTELGAAGTPLGVLKVLQGGDTRPGDLAAALHISPSVVSRALPPLERAALVERVDDPTDARASLLRLTDRGRQRLARLQREYVDQVRGVLPDWTDEDAVAAVDILNRLEHALTSTPPSYEDHRRLLDEVDIPVALDEDDLSPVA